MQRLTASDALFLYQERSRDDFMHSMRIAVVDLKGRSSKELRDVMIRSCSMLEPYHWVVEQVPLFLHHPMWRVDADFDVEGHVHRAGCPSPGTRLELAEIVSRIASRPLDLTRPLWECWIVDGLEHGRAAVVVKVHHALADGVATGLMTMEACETEPTALSDLPAPPVFPAEPGLSALEHIGLAARDTARHVSRAVPDLITRQRVVRRSRAGGSGTPTPAKFSEAPTISLNHAPGAQRTYAYDTFPLADLKAARPAFGATLNDLFLAMGAGAMRRLLIERDELPDRPLVACVPVSTRRPEDPASSGNRLGTLAVRLRTDLADPRERALASKLEADASKASFRLTAGARPENYVDCLPPALQLLLLRAARQQAQRGKPIVGNVGMSNVPGPAKPLFLADFEIESLHGVGPLTAGLGLNITAWSYAGQLNVSYLASREALPDLWPFVDHFRASFEEICACAASSAHD